MRRIPPLQAVRVFEAAARHENFTSAARELGMTQAAVSYQIRLLEDRLGMPLFLRSKQRVLLSDAGRRIMPLVSGAFDSLEEAFATLVADDDGVLSISTTQTFASNWLAPRLGGFQLERPELAVRLHSEIALVDFARDEIDVAIRTGAGPWPGLRHHFLTRLVATPMCSAAFAEHHRLERPEQLLSLPLLSPEDSWWRIWFEAAQVARPEGGARGRGIRLDSQAAEGNAAMAGQGVALLNPVLWRAELLSGRLIQPFPIVAVERTSYWLVYPEQKRGRAKIRAFREWLLAEMEKESALGPPQAFAGPSEGRRP